MTMLIFCLSVILVVGPYTLYTLICRAYARRGRTHHSSAEYQPEVTLLVCAYNEEAVISRKMENIGRCSYPREKLKILFINDHSTDRTREMILEYAEHIPFQVEVVDNLTPRGKPNALMFGYERITTEITIQTDADTLMDAGAVDALTSNFADPGVGGANGVMKINSSDRSGNLVQQERLYRRFYDLWRMGESSIHSISISNGCIMAYRTELVRDVRLGTMADDTELLFEIIRRGSRVVYDPAAVAVEWIPTKVSERFFQKMRRAKGLFQVYTKYISCLGKGRFGSIIFPFALAQVVILPYIFMIGVGAYIGLVFQQTWWLFGIALFFIPKLGSAILGMCSTQVVMAMSPFHRTGAWRTMPTAREGLRDDMEIENLQNERSKNLKEELDKDRERKRKVG